MSLRDAEGYYLPVDLEGWTGSLKHKSAVELNETEEALRDGLETLRQLIKEKGVPTSIDDDFLTMFLRSKKFSIKKSFEQIKSYSYQRHSLMNYYGFMFASRIMPVLYHNICGILPKRDREGRVIIFFMASKFRPDLCEADDVLRAVQAIGHFALTFPATQVSGFALIADMKVESLQTLHLGFKYMKWVLPTLHAFPGRFQKIDFINTNPIIRALLTIIRPLTPMKLLKRTTFHGSDEKALLSVYDASLLPVELGGTMGSIKDVSQKYIQKFEEFIPKLQATNRYFKRKDTVAFPES